jgi:hypothetical protein
MVENVLMDGKHARPPRGATSTLFTAERAGASALGLALGALMCSSCSPPGPPALRPDASSVETPPPPNEEVVSDAGTNDAVAAPPWTFSPSNVALSALRNREGLDLLIGNGDCGGRFEVDIDTAADAVALCRGPGQPVELLKSTGRSGEPIAILFLRSLRIEAGMTVLVRGPLPLVVVALETVIIDGSLRASALGDHGFAGGSSGRPGGKGDGLGAGAGIGAAPGGGGGGSYCGQGGNGGPNHTGGAGNRGGPVYGASTLVPLRGGSSGGNGGIWEAGGGGGAIQIVARNSIRVGSTGIINVGGGGGEREGAGGGSGGALLLEAPAITIAGVLAANGGGGGSGGQFGEDATADDHPAAGGGPVMLNTGEGGVGAAAEMVDGADGQSNPTFASGDFSGGGGGGAGYVRINANLDDLVITGTISPARASRCYSRGVLPTP